MNGLHSHRAHSRPQLLLRCLAGRHLTGTATDSDPTEIWEICDHLSCRRTAKQRVHWTTEGGCVEILRIGLGSWLQLCQRGIPAALDVMFAPAELTEVDLIGEFRTSFHLTSSTADTAFRAAQNARPDQHARLEANLDDLHRWGRYDPTEWARRQRGLVRIGAAA